jgi:hypothetical protein
MIAGFVLLIVLALALWFLHSWLGWFGVMAGGAFLAYLILDGLAHDYIVSRFTRRKPSVPGVCGKCGYDLRGNPSGKICPECGGAIADNSREKS